MKKNENLIVNFIEIKLDIRKVYGFWDENGAKKLF